MYVVFGHDRKYAEALDPRRMQHVITDFDKSLEQAAGLRQAITRKDSGRPGHYYGRDIMIEGQMPITQFLLAAQEFGGDQQWYEDDKKFSDYMKRNPIFSYFSEV